MPPNVLEKIPLDSAHTAEVLHEIIRKNIGERNHEHWFKNRTTFSIENNTVTLGVSTKFIVSFIRKQFSPQIHQAVRSVFGPETAVKIVVDATATHLELQSESQKKSEPTQVGELMTTSTRPQTSSTKSSVRKTNGFQKRRYASLEDFVCGLSNELPYAAVQIVSQTPGENNNPLFIYGGVGLGKTHLLEACCLELRKHHPNFRVDLFTAEEFTNYFTQALREKSLPSFRNRFRKVDAFLVDDVDFLEGKPKIQQEFLQTLKHLESHQCQIVLAAGCHPRLLSKLSEELSSRFISGLMCRLESPDAQTRGKIVKRKAKDYGVALEPRAVEYVASRFRKNVRELEGALTTLAVYAERSGRKVSLNQARKILAEMERDCVKVVRFADVEKAVCTFFGVEAKQLKSSSRQRTLSQPRMLAMYLMRKHTKAAYSEIGEHFGGRNHSTAMSADKTVKGWMKNKNTLKIHNAEVSMEEVILTLEEQLLAS